MGALPLIIAALLGCLGGVRLIMPMLPLDMGHFFLPKNKSKQGALPTPTCAKKAGHCPRQSGPLHPQERAVAAAKAGCCFHMIFLKALGKRLWGQLPA